MKFTFATKQLAVLPLVALLSVACGSQKTGPISHEAPAQTSEGYPAQALDGYQPHRLSVDLPEKGSGEHPVKIEIVPGKNMEVDCNHHFLMGGFTQKELSDGNHYYVFESNGQTASTLMGCPDNSRHMEFVQGKSLFIDHNEIVPAVVYTSEGITIKLRNWNPSPAYEIGKEVNFTVETEATQALKAYPESLEGYVRYLLFLPEIKDSQKERKVEIIPGVTAEVDCNQYRLEGRFVEKDIEGWGYNYLVFESDGGIRSTLMGCPDDTRRTEVVTADTQLMNYNSRLPVVVFVPEKENFSLQYRIWEAGDLN